MMWWERFGNEVTAVDWEAGLRTHNWRTYIPLRLRKIWHHLSMETKVVAYIMAEDRADDDVWD